MITFLCAILLLHEEPSAPTWIDDIQGIFVNNCMPCHGSGGAGPFHLLSYEDVAGRSSFIVELTSKGLMPPWIVDDVGFPVKHKRAISKEDIAIIQKWIEADKPMGEGAERIICAPDPTEADAIGHTDPQKPWIVPPESEPRWHTGIRDKRTFVLPINNDIPIKVTSFEFQTTAPRAVQMVCFVFDSQGRGKIFDSWDAAEPGYEMMGDIGWVPSGTHGKIGPGLGQVTLPRGYHWELPSGADLIAETHFRPTGKKESLSCSVKIKSDIVQDSRAVQEIVSMIRRITIEAGSDKYVAQESLAIPVDVDVIGITPRAGPECSAMKILATDGEGEQRILLSYSDWDPHYGETVFYKNPFRLKKDETIESIWEFNNSESNPRNPFVPAQFIDLARKTGVANFILHVVAADPEESDDLYEWNLSMLRKRQRANQ